jgi:hypothetical protein
MIAIKQNPNKMQQEDRTTPQCEKRIIQAWVSNADTQLRARNREHGQQLATHS